MYPPPLRAYYLPDDPVDPETQTDAALEPPGGTATAVMAGPPRFLVVLYSTLDDLPVGLFDTREEAEAFAQGVADDPRAAAERVKAVLGRNPKYFLGVSVIEFAGPDPVRRDVPHELGTD